MNIAMQRESIDAVKAAVESGVGVGLLYRENVDHTLKSSQLRAIDIPCLKKMHINLFMIYRKGENFSRHAKDFVSLSPHWSK